MLNVVSVILLPDGVEATPHDAGDVEEGRLWSVGSAGAPPGRVGARMRTRVQWYRKLRARAVSRRFQLLLPDR